MIKFLFLEGIQGNVFTIIHQGFIILAGSGREVEIFYLWLLEIFGFFENKKFLSQGVCKIEFFISWRMIGNLLGYHVQQTEKF